MSLAADVDYLHHALDRAKVDNLTLTEANEGLRKECAHLQADGYRLRAELRHLREGDTR